MPRGADVQEAGCTEGRWRPVRSWAEGHRPARRRAD